MKQIKPWGWVPTLYFAEGIPYVLVMTVSVIMYKSMGLSNEAIAFYTSWLYLPWVIKPLWSPLVDLAKTKRWWITSMQLLIGGGLAAVALTLPTEWYFKGSLAVLFLLAFSSATHDIAADGFYMLGLKDDEQAFYSGIRSTFYRIAMVVGQGLMVWLAGMWSRSMGVHVAWSIVFIIAAGIFVALAGWHFFALPKPTEDKNKSFSFSELGRLFLTFFTKKDIALIVSFILLFRLGEAQLGKISQLFVMDSVEKGGLGLPIEQIGVIYGTIGVIGLLAGGVIGGMLVARDGLKKWLWPFVAAMNVPNLVYVYFAYAQPQNLILICSGVALEQLGYGLGITAFMLYMIEVSKGEYKTAHYALCTGLMAAGMMIPGMWSGSLQEAVGYENFFLLVCVCTLPGFALTALVKKQLADKKS